MSTFVELLLIGGAMRLLVSNVGIFRPKLQIACLSVVGEEVVRYVGTC